MSNFKVRKLQDPYVSNFKVRMYLKINRWDFTGILLIFVAFVCMNDVVLSVCAIRIRAASEV